MNLKTQESFGHSRNIVSVINVDGKVVGDLHKKRGSWGNPTTYQFFPEEHSPLVSAHGTKIKDVLTAAQK